MAVIITAPNKFKAKPSRTIVRIGILPELKITALGPVATGNINAQLALIAAGTIRRRGSISAPIAAAARIGISSAVVAVLLVISVMKVTLTQSAAINNKGCSPLKPARASPIIRLIPELTKAEAIQIPPANSPAGGLT